MESTYSVFVKPDAARELRNLPSPIKADMAALLVDLEEDPRPHDAVELRGHRDYYRVRFEGYRVVYRVSDSRRRVAVLRIRRRDQAYRGLESP